MAKERDMTVSEVARQAGVSVRTLHYYDEIGLLRPSGATEAGYRLYTRAELNMLARIMLLRELDFPLRDIADMLKGGMSAADIERQRELLCARRDRLSRIIERMDGMLKGDMNMDFSAFDNSDFERQRDEYAAEAKSRWGGTEAYMQSEKRTAGYGKAKWDEVNAGLSAVLAGFAALRDGDPSSEAAQAQVKRWRDYMSANFYDCTPEIMEGLADMYVSDERFKRNIDSQGAGTAEFIQKAVMAALGK